MLSYVKHQQVIIVCTPSPLSAGGGGGELDRASAFRGGLLGKRGGAGG